MDDYAAKLHLERPTYSTFKKEGFIFISSLDFNGKNYTGDADQNEIDVE